jgi:hypothetical protein
VMFEHRRNVSQNLQFSSTAITGVTLQCLGETVCQFAPNLQAQRLFSALSQRHCTGL